MQTWPAIPDTDTLQVSRQELLDRDTSVRSCFAGTTFPAGSIDNGMLCYRTDQKMLYELVDYTVPTWHLLIDLNKTTLHKEEADAAYQPLSAGLNALLALSTNGVVKRTGANTWSILVSTAAGESLLTAATAAAQRTALGLSAMATRGVGPGLRDDGAGNLQASGVSSTIAANQSLAAQHHDTLFLVNAALTLSVPKLSAVWDGWSVSFVAKGGQTTITPDPTEILIVNGTALGTGVSYAVPQGNWGNITHIAGLNVSVNTSGGGSAPTLRQQVFLSSGTFTTPANTTAATVFKFTIVGGGAAGAAPGGASSNGGNGGGAGATAIYWASGLAANQGCAITVGAAAGASSAVVGATTVTAGAGAAASSGLPGLGGTATNGIINIPGGDGGSGATGSTTGAGGSGGASSMGGGGRGGSSSSNSGSGGEAYGSGGGGANGAGTPGAGKQGIVLVEWVL